MADESAFHPYCNLMPALGRNFQLGDLYDYRTDRIVKGNIN